MPENFFRRPLRVVFKEAIQRPPYIHAGFLALEYFSGRLMNVNFHSRVEEVKVEHPQEGIERSFQDAAGFTAAPDRWKSEHAHQITHAVLQALDLGRNVRCYYRMFFRH